jgi:hypothetical protein
MSNETLEFLKWFVGVPSAVIATITIPFLIKKYHLECKKLEYEIRQLQMNNRLCSRGGTEDDS